jgi:hypothetical protein
LEAKVRRALVSLLLEESQKRPELGPVRKRTPAKKKRKRKKAAVPPAASEDRQKAGAGA